jgi:hypothetical protein
MICAKRLCIPLLLLATAMLWPALSPSRSSLLLAQSRTSRPTSQPPILQPPVRINAGADHPIVDALGTAWLADQDFEGGDTVDRGDIEIANTRTPEIYRTEHFNMDNYTLNLPNGTYTVKLHFCETFPAASVPHGRVFDVHVQDRELAKLDVFVEAGGARKALVKTFDDVKVTDGTLSIVFIPQVQSAEINAIEVLPVAPR